MQDLLKQGQECAPLRCDLYIMTVEKDYVAVYFVLFVSLKKERVGFALIPQTLNACVIIFVKSIYYFGQRIGIQDISFFILAA